MNKTSFQAVEVVKGLAYEVEDVGDVDVVVCPPFTSLKSISTFIEYEKPNFFLGAQNMHWDEEGALTGEVSPLMLKELGVGFVIVGHSERRKIFLETDEMVNKKVKSALSHDLTAIICVGETLEEKEKNRTQNVIKEQVFSALDGVGIDEIEQIVFAYEPIWAIGTGKSAFPEDANDVIRHIRALVGSRLGPEKARGVRIQYGGSVKPENIADFMAEPDIDGALVGGASLDPKSFAGIINFRG